MIEIDGSYGEGGGQILRTSISLSSILRQPVRVFNVRAKRPRPGLANQHLKGISAVQQLTSADVKGLSIGSTEVEFHPKAMGKGRYVVDVGTAGSISLILQVVSLPAAYAEGRIEIEITGGTDVPWSPPSDYMANVFYHIVRKFGVRANFEVIKRGYYPKGGGNIRVSFEPTKRLNAVDLTRRGELRGIHGIAHSLNLPPHIVEREAMSAKKILLDYETKIRLESGRDFSTGTGLTLWAEYDRTVMGASSLGKPGKRAERVGEEAARELLKEMKGIGVVDMHMCDQIIPYMGLASGRSRVLVSELTNHLKTNVYIVENILGVKFRTEEADKGYIVEVDGIGFER